MKFAFSLLFLLCMALSASAQMSKADALATVRLIRGCSDAVASPSLFNKMLRSNLTELGLTLRQLGTSSAGLNRITLRCERLNAERMLHNFRTRNHDSTSGVLFMEHARKAGLKLAYYGINVKERRTLLGLERESITFKREQRRERLQRITNAMNPIMLLLMKKQLEKRIFKKDTSVPKKNDVPGYGPVRVGNIP